MSLENGQDEGLVPQQASASKGTILVVDDEASIRSLIVSVLRREGFSLLQAANGADALELCVLTPRKVDLMITDLTMPLMNGIELARKVLTVKPEMRVILLSGRSSETLRKVRGVNVFPKPFTIKGLLTKITEVLNRAG